MSTEEAKPANINHEGYHRRLEAVEDVLKKFGLEATQITPVEYIEHGPFPYNNFIYRVDLAHPFTPAHLSSSPFSSQPGTTPPPATGLSSLIIRLSNPRAEGLNNASRIENEVAALSLAHEALRRSSSAQLAELVPAVFAWQAYRPQAVPAEAGFGWTMAELRPRANLDTQFAALSSHEQRAAVIEQVADVVAALQRAELPPGAHAYGGLNFDEAGHVVSGESPLVRGGPWDGYAEFWAAKVRGQMEDAEGSPLLDGWRPGGLRERLEKFLAEGGVEKILEGVDVSKKALMHGDLTMNNMLYDSTTGRLTALLDFDWAGVAHPVHDFFSGLWDLGGGTHPEDKRLQAAVLKGDFSDVPGDLSDEDKVKWENAEAWDNALAARGAVRPSTIKGVERLELLRELEDSLCPFQLSNAHILKTMPKERLEAQRKEMQEKITKVLEKGGF
ncbi:Phosphotransferase enzyme family protein [Pleurostoma richardsiae]|uniref:Phosphotransferase enzyme family protein n=1 Tax=Pleurostoma richardsiae TaxID=41990 RepID=A0AA38VEP0_9PEZI|nr:Phosphotransferase enzyme family protein [Pleurostoma richardsiae]